MEGAVLQGLPAFCTLCRRRNGRGADKSTDVNVANSKQPYEDEETEEEVPEKYNIILDLPKDDKGNIAPRGFYKLDW